VVEAVGSSGVSATVGLANIAKQLEEEQKKLAEQAKANQAPKEEVQAFQKEVRKSPFATTGGATDVGVLIRDQTRLNVFSSLKKSDSVDHYKFRNQLPSNVTLGMLGDKELRVQLVSKHGAVLADSDPKSSRYKDYEKAQQGELKLPAGEYLVKVTRTGNTEKKETQNYAIQISAGKFTKDYDTVAREPRPGDGVPQQSSAQLNLQGMLTSASAFVSSLPPIGTPATAKLMGTVFSGKF